MRVCAWLLVLTGIGALVPHASLGEQAAAVTAASPAGLARGPQGAGANNPTAIAPQGMAPTATGSGAVKAASTRGGSARPRGVAQVAATRASNTTTNRSATFGAARGGPGSNTTSINGTGLAAKGFGPAKTSTRVKNGANINGTYVRPKN